MRGPHLPCRGLAPAPSLEAPAGSAPEVPGYHVGAPLGQGGFARVFAAARLVDGAEVALKIARPEAGAAAAMLAHEATVLRAVGPPAVPALLEEGCLPDGTPFLAVERLAGPSLAEHLVAGGGALPDEALARLVPPLLKALEALHRAGFAHGDLKPENIFVGGEPARARLIDLALAAPLGAPDLASPPAPIAGTPEYMSPEQCRGEPPDARSDLYALGALLLELATGRPPFLGSAPEVRHAHQNLRPPPPAALAPMPQELARAIEWCLAKAPADRPASAAALGLALAPAPGATPRPPREAAVAAPAERPGGARRTVGAVFLQSAADAAALRAAAAALGGVHAHADGPRHALVFDAGGGRNPVQRALEAARLALAGGLAPRALVDLVPVLVRARPGGADRYVAAAFSEPASWPLPADPPGLLATVRAAEVLPGVALTPVPGRPGLLASVGRSRGAEPTVVRGGAPPLLGREEVLERLVAAARTVARERTPSVVAVLGEAGLGKSHLSAALGDRLRALAPAPEVVELRARPAEDGDALGALLRWLLDVPADAPAPPGAGRALLELALAPDGLAGAWPAVALAAGWLQPGSPELASTAAAPGALAGLGARAAAGLLRRRATERPVCVLLDDAHLASGAALDALEQAALAEAGAPLLVCALARPDLLVRRPAWGERATHRVSERLDPLSAEAAEALCRRQLAPADGIPAAALAVLAARAGGVPLLLVELVRGLRAEGLVRPAPGGRAHYLATDALDRVIDLPAVEWLAAAALRSMPRDLAAHAQLSALLGDEVPADEVAGVLTHLVGAGLGAAFPLDAGVALRRLAEHGLLARHRDGATSFRLPVVRDAVARSTPEALRRAIHEAAYRLHARPGLLARPARMARLAVHARETGRLDEAGAAFLWLAADRAARHAYLEAEGLYSRSLESLPADDAAGRLAALRGRGLMWDPLESTCRHASLSIL